MPQEEKEGEEEEEEGEEEEKKEEKEGGGGEEEEEDEQGVGWRNARKRRRRGGRQEEEPCPTHQNTKQLAKLDSRCMKGFIWGAPRAQFRPTAKGLAWLTDTQNASPAMGSRGD